MKKTVIAIVMFIAASAMRADFNSRFLFGAGGGLAFEGQKNKKIENQLGGMGIVCFDYIFTYEGTALGVGFKTGVDIAFLQPRLKAGKLTDYYIETDYQGKDLEYTITAYTTQYKQQSLQIDVPLMLAIRTDLIYFNIGAKFLFPLWNRYSQTMSESTIVAYSPDEDKTYVNDPVTGVVSDAQRNISGREKTSPVYIAFSMEFGMAWKIKDNHRIGFEIFADPVAMGFGGKKTDTQCVIEVDPATSAEGQANVRVNTLPCCYDFKDSFGQMGVKLIYCFDVRHKGKAKAQVKQEPVMLMTPAE